MLRPLCLPVGTCTLWRQARSSPGLTSLWRHHQRVTDSPARHCYPWPRSGQCCTTAEQLQRKCHLKEATQATNLFACRRSVATHASPIVLSAANTSVELLLKVRHILLPHDQADLFERLQQELEGGARFGELAALHSVCPSASRGGQLGGWLKRGVVPQMLEDAAFDAKVGEIATAETEKGLHILQVIECREVAIVRSMRVEELGELLDAADAPSNMQLIDVREPFEHNIAALPHFQLMPMSRMEEWLPGVKASLNTAVPTVVLCHAGVRSNMVAHALVEQGFTDVSNVVGGIEAYSCIVDSSVPRY